MNTYDVTVTATYAKVTEKTEVVRVQAFSRSQAESLAKETMRGAPVPQDSRLSTLSVSRVAEAYNPVCTSPAQYTDYRTCGCS